MTPNRWLLIFCALASKFCDRHKNHPFCKKPTDPKPTTEPNPEAPETPPSIDLETNCTNNCTDIVENEDVCAVSSDGEFLAFRNKCEMERYGCENIKNLTSVNVRFCEEPTCLRVGSSVCVRLGSRHYARLENECALQLFSCQFGQKYKIVSDDKCGRQPSCADDVCVQEFLPVCGMNRDKHHHLFNNDCELRRHNCVFKETYRPTALGRCKTDHQLCHDSCAAIDEPVCGQNSEKHVKIFSNTCDLDNYNCKHDDQYKPVAMAECQNGCGNVNQAVSCGGKEAVCASNDIEFKWFDCKDAMKSFNCEKQKDFKVVDESKCNCPQKECTTDLKICATTGTELRQFKNTCELRDKSKCGFKEQIVPINKIFCNSGSDPLSSDSICLNIYYPICTIGIDKQYKWYTSPCDLRATNLEDDTDAVIVDKDYCKDQFDPDRCAKHRCDYRYDPVCATDASTNTTQWFGNKCAINYFNCFFWTKFEATNMNACEHVVTIDAEGNV